MDRTCSACVKEYDPAEPIAITLTVEQWETVQHWIKYGMDWNRAKAYWWSHCCGDKKEGAATAAKYDKAAAEAEQLYKIVEEIINPSPPIEE